MVCDRVWLVHLIVLVVVQAGVPAVEDGDVRAQVAAGEPELRVVAALLFHDFWNNLQGYGFD